MAQFYSDSARVVMERCDLLSTYSEEPDRITRRFATPPMHQVHDAVSNWLRAAGMSVETDAIGNLIGRYASELPTAKTLLLGSHLDTVRDAGKYDGLLGVMVALACLERLHERNERLPFSIELVCFADEEGLRYPSVYLGSKAATGRFDLQALELLDVDGVSMADAIRTFSGEPDPVRLTTARWSRDELLGYCEVHIEQGPVLEARDIPLAAVSSIVGQRRLQLQFRGEQGHAGTLPMDLRRDALCAAAEFVLAAEAAGREVAGLVATVGQLRVQPGASNVVPGLVELSLDIRHENDAIRDQYARQLVKRAERICTERQLQFVCQHTQDNLTVACAPRLFQRWLRALEIEGYPTFALSSGAGHDAVALSELTDVAMLFVRCRGGISHNPLEAVLQEDIAAALAVLERFVLLTAKEVADGSL